VWLVYVRLCNKLKKPAVAGFLFGRNKKPRLLLSEVWSGFRIIFEDLLAEECKHDTEGEQGEGEANEHSSAELDERSPYADESHYNEDAEEPGGHK
jgi:hypothetical protein